VHAVSARSVFRRDCPLHLRAPHSFPTRRSSDLRASPASVRIAAMRIVAIDASTEVCSVALGIDERWWERSEVAGQSHSELLLPMLSALLDENHVTMQDLDGVAFGAGPGSFTGLRIACGV